MKRILIVFGLLVCFALPAQIASAAYSYDPALLFKANIEALADAGSKDGVADFFPTFINSKTPNLDIIQVYGTKVLNTPLSVAGFDMLQGVKFQEVELFIYNNIGTSLNMSVKEAYSVQDIANDVFLDGLHVRAGDIFMYVKNSLVGDMVFLVTATGHHNPVPVPAALWLMGSGLAGLVALRRRAS